MRLALGRSPSAGGSAFHRATKRDLALRGTMSVYRVTGAAKYRGHEPGATFEAVLPEPVERRAIARRVIEVVERSTPTLRPGSYRFGRRGNG